MSETSIDVVKRYLGDAIAAEKNFEAQLHSFANESAQPLSKALFEEQANETKDQSDRLLARLTELGGAASGAGSFMGHLLGLAPKVAHLSHENSDDPARNLVVAFTIKSSELATYESLAAMSEAAGDTETLALVRALQAEEKRTAEKIWQLLSVASLP